MQSVEPSTAMPTHLAGNHNAGPSRLHKEDMKRTKRLSIEFWHREVVITVEGPVLFVPNSEPVRVDNATVCPTCGGRWITIVARADGDAPAETERMVHALQQSGLHLQVSSAGELRICQQSFDAIKETL
jgi:hypothetical protein